MTEGRSHSTKHDSNQPHSARERLLRWQRSAHQQPSYMPHTDSPRFVDASHERSKQRNIKMGHHESSKFRTLILLYLLVPRTQPFGFHNTQTFRGNLVIFKCSPRRYTCDLTEPWLPWLNVWRVKGGHVTVSLLRGLSALALFYHL